MTWIRHNQGLFVGLLISAGLLAWTWGCESKVGSLKEPARLVTRAELTLEVEQLSRQLELELELLIKEAEIKLAELDRLDEIKKMLYEFGMIAVEAGTVNPAGLIGLVAGILGVGAVVDNRIKDKVIKNRPLPNRQPPG